jgi:RNase P subunit RPR2
MKRCTRCHSSLIMDFSTDFGQPHLIWKCLGCGRETFVDAARQAEDERLRTAIAATGPTRLTSLVVGLER